jgi:hypothetical protein
MPTKASDWFQIFLTGFSLYAGCSMAVMAIYGALLENGVLGWAVPPLMAVGFTGFVTALVSLFVMMGIGVRSVWRTISRSAPVAA